MRSIGGANENAQITDIQVKNIKSHLGLDEASHVKNRPPPVGLLDIQDNFLTSAYGWWGPACLREITVRPEPDGLIFVESHEL